MLELYRPPGLTVLTYHGDRYRDVINYRLGALGEELLWRLPSTSAAGGGVGSRPSGPVSMAVAAFYAGRRGRVHSGRCPGPDRGAHHGHPVRHRRCAGWRGRLGGVHGVGGGPAEMDGGSLRPE